MVFNRLKGIKTNEKIELFKNRNKKIWHIKKKYDDENEDQFLNDNEDSLGFTISVYQESINKEFDEYLVNFDYFIQVMHDYGFDYEEKMMHNGKEIKGIGSFEDMYVLSMTDNNYDAKENKMSNQEKEISFLNKYFVFKKVRDVDTNILYDYYVNNDSTDGSKIDFNVGKAVKTNQRIILES